MKLEGFLLEQEIRRYLRRLEKERGRPFKTDLVYALKPALEKIIKEQTQEEIRRECSEYVQQERQFHRRSK